MLEILDFTFVSKISDLGNRMMGLKKYLWKNERTVHNSSRSEIVEIKDIKETTTYFVMSSNEMRVERGLEILFRMKTILEKLELNAQLGKEPKKLIQEIQEIRTNVESLEVMINVSEHKKSIWINLN